jgi:hypothetical protein
MRQNPPQYMNARSYPPSPSGRTSNKGKAIAIAGLGLAIALLFMAAAVGLAGQNGSGTDPGLNILKPEILDDDTASPDDGYVSITIYKGAGIDEVTGDGGSYEKGSSQYVSATVLAGERFKGWYHIGSDVPVSTSLSGYVPIGNSGILIALTESDFYSGTETLSVDPLLDYESMVCVVFDHWTGRYVTSLLNPEELTIQVAPGRYDVAIAGSTEGDFKTEKTTVLIDGTFHKEYTWKFNGRTYGMTWNGTFSEIDSLHQQSYGRVPVTDYDRAAFVTYESDVVKKFASVLSEQSEGMSYLDRANFVLAFVQQITAYEYDSDYNGQKEYWKYPIETLYDCRGDCEDTVILYCALMKALSYDAAMCLYLGEQYVDKGHAAAGISIPGGARGTYYQQDGKKYYYCETTSDTMRVGDKSSEYSSTRLIVIS